MKTAGPRGPAAKAALLTVKEIPSAVKRALQSGRDVWLTDTAARGKGRLVCRCTSAGSAILMYRYTAPDGSRHVIRIGNYDAEGRSGLTLERARDEAGKLAKRYQDGDGNLRDELREEAEAKATAKEVAKVALEAAERREKRGSLTALLDVYEKTLAGRSSGPDATNIFKLHLRSTHPDLCSKPAANVEPKEIRDVLAVLVAAGKRRTAAKLRSYLAAAYNVALRAELDASAPAGMSDFDVKANPAAAVAAIKDSMTPRERALTLPELTAFWKRARKLTESPARDALQACVLLGGQRPAQVLRLTPADVDMSAGTVTLRDKKGRNRHANPRRHVLPIPTELLPIIKRRSEACADPEQLIFGGTHPQTLSDLVGEMAKAMNEADELDRGLFQMRDLRRTAETHLAALGVSTDTRAQLQSHGLGGIQARHYDRHDYMQEKRDALALWAQRLKARPAAKKAANVVPLRRGKAAA
jgi:integrase